MCDFISGIRQITLPGIIPIPPERTFSIEFDRFPFLAIMCYFPIANEFIERIEARLISEGILTASEIYVSNNSVSSTVEWIKI